VQNQSRVENSENRTLEDVREVGCGEGKVFGFVIIWSGSLRPGPAVIGAEFETENGGINLGLSTMRKQWILLVGSVDTPGSVNLV
jgi:hypothetical protein